MLETRGRLGEVETSGSETLAELRRIITDIGGEPAVIMPQDKFGPPDESWKDKLQFALDGKNSIYVMDRGRMTVRIFSQEQNLFSMEAMLKIGEEEEKIAFALKEDRWKYVHNDESEDVFPEVAQAIENSTGECLIYIPANPSGKLPRQIFDVTQYMKAPQQPVRGPSEAEIPTGSTKAPQRPTEETPAAAISTGPTKTPERPAEPGEQIKVRRSTTAALALAAFLGGVAFGSRIGGQDNPNSNASATPPEIVDKDTEVDAGAVNSGK